MQDVYVIIPAYNEGKAIKEVLESVLKIFPNVVCVNDGSKDDTAEQIEQTKAVLVNHPINMGQGAALQTGIDYALQDPKAAYFITFDADGQHSLDDAQAMVKEIRKGKAEIILGSRFLGKAENISGLKKAILRMAVAFSNMTSGLRLTDAHNGLRVFNRHVASELQLRMPDFAHASEIIERIAEKKFTYKEVPVTILYTEYSVSKGQSIINAVNISFDLFINRIMKR
jgi:glycosyltransferase involved in cell wall biosynthesis